MESGSERTDPEGAGKDRRRMEENMEGRSTVWKRIAWGWKRWKVRNILVILLLVLFLAYLGVATNKHIREYNESLVGVRVMLPGTVTKQEFLVLKAVAQQDEDGAGMHASAVLDASEYYGEFVWQEGDKGKIRAADGRSIQKQAVHLEREDRGTRITFDFEDAEVRPGDEVEMVLDVRLTKVALNAVPFEVLRQRDNRYFFYEVVKRNGIWGYEYIVKETAPRLKNVESGYAYFRGYAAKAPVVIESDAELSDGMRVKFLPE